MTLIYLFLFALILGPLIAWAEAPRKPRYDPYSPLTHLPPPPPPAAPARPALDPILGSRAEYDINGNRIPGTGHWGIK